MFARLTEGKGNVSGCPVEVASLLQGLANSFANGCATSVSRLALRRPGPSALPVLPGPRRSQPAEPGHGVIQHDDATTDRRAASGSPRPQRGRPAVQRGREHRGAAPPPDLFPEADGPG